MAEIYLNYRKDKRMYAQCYKQIVEKSPTAQSYILLGDAYMAIQGKHKMTFDSEIFIYCI